MCKEGPVCWHQLTLTAIAFQQKWELLIIYILVLVNLSLLQMWELLLLGTAGTDALKLKSVTECKYDLFYLKVWLIFIFTIIAAG